MQFSVNRDQVDVHDNTRQFAAEHIEERRLIVVHVDLVPIDAELHGDYVNDKNFKRRFQQWLNTLWKEKDEQIDKIKSSYKSAGQ